MNYSEIRFFIINNKENFSKEEIKTKLLEVGAERAEIDLIITKVYSEEIDRKSIILLLFLIIIILGLVIGFFLGTFTSIMNTENQFSNKKSGEFNSGLLMIELGVYGVADGEITQRHNDYFSFKIKLKEKHKSININDLTLRLISRDKVTNYVLNPKNIDEYPFKLKNILGNINDNSIDPSDVFNLEFITLIDIKEDELFDLVFLENGKQIDVVTIITPITMKTNYVILKQII